MPQLEDLPAKLNLRAGLLPFPILLPLTVVPLLSILSSSSTALLHLSFLLSCLGGTEVWPHGGNPRDLY